MEAKSSNRLRARPDSQHPLLGMAGRGSPELDLTACLSDMRGNVRMVRNPVPALQQRYACFMRRWAVPGSAMHAIEVAGGWQAAGQIQRSAIFSGQ